MLGVLFIISDISYAVHRVDLHSDCVVRLQHEPPTVLTVREEFRVWLFLEFISSDSPLLAITDFLSQRHSNDSKVQQRFLSQYSSRLHFQFVQMPTKLSCTQKIKQFRGKCVQTKKFPIQAQTPRMKNATTYKYLTLKGRKHISLCTGEQTMS